MTDQERITELEIQLAHLQRLNDDLNEVVTDHTRRLMKFEATLQGMETRLEELREVRKEKYDSADERPPHW